MITIKVSGCFGEGNCDWDVTHKEASEEASWPDGGYEGLH